MNLFIKTAVALRALNKSLRSLDVAEEVAFSLHRFADNLNLPTHRLVLAAYLDEILLDGYITKEQHSRLYSLALTDNGETVARAREISNLSMAKGVDFELIFKGRDVVEICLYLKSGINKDYVFNPKSDELP